ncbi:hypothetical protein RvY_15318 [Ramazzottius varieornatus]|uniref:C2H2-type domain-containing protein n=1 Tax=Ramazzottius varieornatus TaxID=947166 RepID=A0A1D1VUG1_RAMVA|nr:hypothetical protein RvY_15318 [Ramazzottius varieornatus]
MTDPLSPSTTNNNATAELDSSSTNNEALGATISVSLSDLKILCEKLGIDTSSNDAASLWKSIENWTPPVLDDSGKWWDACPKTQEIRCRANGKNGINAMIIGDTVTLSLNILPELTDATKTLADRIDKFVTEAKDADACEQCLESFDDIGSLVTHYYKCEASSIKIPCKQCGQRLKTKENLKAHGPCLEKPHDVAVCRTCWDTCDKNDSATWLREHYRKRHWDFENEGGGYECPECRMKFYYKVESDNHQCSGLIPESKDMKFVGWDFVMDQWDFLIQGNETSRVYSKFTTLVKELEKTKNEEHRGMVYLLVDGKNVKDALLQLGRYDDRLKFKFQAIFQTFFDGIFYVGFSKTNQERPEDHMAESRPWFGLPEQRSKAIKYIDQNSVTAKHDKICRIWETEGFVVDFNIIDEHSEYGARSVEAALIQLFNYKGKIQQITNIRKEPFMSSMTEENTAWTRSDVKVLAFHFIYRTFMRLCTGGSPAPKLHYYQLKRSPT